MRFGIRKKLILAFILIALIPFLVAIVSFLKTTSEVINDFGEDIDKFDDIEDEIIATTLESFNYIDDYDSFSAQIDPVLTKYKTSLTVVDPSWTVLYDSENKELRNQPITENELTNAELKLTQKKVWFSFKKTNPLIRDDEVIAYAIVEFPANIINFLPQVFGSLGKSMTLSFAVFLVLIVLLSWYIARSVLRPLHELNIATSRIAQGDLDFKIKYSKPDELGRFGQRFDLMRKKLKESLEKQAEYEKSRNEIIASISHDLRTPISSIKGYVEGLQDGVAQSPEMFERYLRVIRDKTEQLDRLIDDLSQFSQQELNHLPMNLKLEDSKQVLESIFNSISLDSEFNGAAISINQPLPSVPIRVDKLRIHQVLSNLVQNAILYSNTRQNIQVNANANEQFLEISVRDTGDGIAPEDLPYIFDTFYRAEKSRSRNLGGTGLGLAICKHIVEAHGGIIRAESTVGQGSAFTFTLPLHSPESLD